MNSTRTGETKFAYANEKVNEKDPVTGSSFSESAQGALEFATGGPLGSTAVRLYQFIGSVTVHHNPTPDLDEVPWSTWPNDETVADGRVSLENLGNLDANGNVYALLADNTRVTVTPSVKGADDYTFTPPTPAQYTLTHQTTHTAIGDTNLSRLNLGVGEEVVFNGLPNDTNTQWTVTNGGLSSMYGCPVTFTAASNACSATVTATAHGQPLPAVTFQVFEPSFHGVSEISDVIHLPVGHVGAGMDVKLVFNPQNVSFYRVYTWEEAPVVITNITGYFTNNAAQIPINGVTLGGAYLNQYTDGGTNYFSGDTIKEDMTASFSSYSLPFYQGSWDYLITNLWTIPGSNQTNFWGISPRTFMLLDSSGDFEISGWGVSTNRSTNDTYY